MTPEKRVVQLERGIEVIRRPDRHGPEHWKRFEDIGWIASDKAGDVWVAFRPEALRP